MYSLLSSLTGIYLPLFMSRERSLRNAIILGYTLNHFSALLPVFTSNVRRVPLFDKDGSKLPIKYARCFYDTVSSSLFVCFLFSYYYPRKEAHWTDNKTRFFMPFVCF